MTNTLHRYSEHYAFERMPNPEPVQDDYIVFAMSSRGINDDDLVEKYRTFLRLALKHDPVNIGDATKGGLIRPATGHESDRPLEARARPGRGTGDRRHRRTDHSGGGL